MSFQRSFPTAATSFTCAFPVSRKTAEFISALWTPNRRSRIPSGFSQRPTNRFTCLLWVPRLDIFLFMLDAAWFAQPFDTGRLELFGDPIKIAEQVGSYRSFGFFSASADGVLAYRTSGSSGALQLTWFDREGKVAGTVGDRDLYGVLAVSPDGKNAIVSRRDTQTGKCAIWLYDFARGTSSRFTFGSASAGSPTWSLDGSRIFFASDANGQYDLYQKPANGTKDEDLVFKSNASKFPTSVSRDGHFLMYLSVDPKASSKYGLWVLPLQGNSKPFPFVQTEFHETHGHFSPDGHFVAYRSDESGHFEIYVRTFSPDSNGDQATTGGKWQITNGAGTRPSWNPNGKELYYVTPDGKVMAGFQSP